MLGGDADMAAVADAIWFPWLLGVFLVLGGMCSLGTGFFQVFGTRVWLNETVGQLLRSRERTAAGGISPAQALSAALASTIGTGSIAGVSAALCLGGPGAVFWMWISALLGMMLSGCEKLLAVRYRRRRRDGSWVGGPMYYLRDGAGRPRLAAWFAAACLPAALIGGNLVQASAIAGGLQAGFGCPPLASGLAAMILAALATAGGLRRVARISSLLVPFMAALYLGGGILVIFCNFQRLPQIVEQIVLCALSPGCAAAGCGGWAWTAAVRHGVARGVFTNEAGLGTSAMAHAAAETDSPVCQGMWGIFEVFVSTLLVCTVTALAVLSSGLPLHPDGPSGAALTTVAFASALGPAGGGIVSISLVLFAFSSILGWCCYGEQGLEYLTGGRGRRLYRLCFLICIPAGSLWQGVGIWQAVDLGCALLAVPNLAGLAQLAPSVWQEFRQEKKHGENQN